MLHFLLATTSHPTVIDLYCVPTLSSIIFTPTLASLHNSANDLLHPAQHDGSQLLADNTSDYVPGADVDEDKIIVINPPDINVVDTPVVGLKRGHASSDIWTWFTNDANSHHIKSAPCKLCNLHINHHKKSEVAKLHLNKCYMFCKLMNGTEDCNRPDWYVQNMKKGKTTFLQYEF